MSIARLMQMARAGVPSAAGGWDISTATYNGESYSLSGQSINPQDVFIKPDGTKMYINGTFPRLIYEYDLTSAWDVSSASFVQSLDVSSQEVQPRGIFFKPDGTKFYVVGAFGDSVYEYDLSSAWDISTASYLQAFSVVTQETISQGLSFKTDGTVMYTVGQGNDEVNQYDLSSAWDISTASHTQSFSVVAEETRPTGLFFKPDGAKMYITGTTGDDVNEYDLSTAWDISTASYVQNFSVSSEDTAPTGIFFKSDGLKMYVTGSSSDTIYQYST